MKKNEKDMAPGQMPEGGPEMMPDGQVKDDEQEKSLSNDDLIKSLDKLVKGAKAGNPTARKDELLHKALGGPLSQTELGELNTILGGGNAQAGLAADVTKSLDGKQNDNIAKALDVSEYLDELHGGLVKSLATLSTAVEKSDAKQGEFNLLLAKAICDVGRVVKGVSERLGVIESQPARGPKSQQRPTGPGRAIEKSFSGEPEQMSRAQLGDALETLLHKSFAEGRSGIAQCGEDLTSAISKAEQSGFVSEPLYAEILALRNVA